MLLLNIHFAKPSKNIFKNKQTLFFPQVKVIRFPILILTTAAVKQIICPTQKGLSIHLSSEMQTSFYLFTQMSFV